MFGQDNVGGAPPPAPSVAIGERLEEEATTPNLPQVLKTLTEGLPEETQVSAQPPPEAVPHLT